MPNNLITIFIEDRKFIIYPHSQVVCDLKEKSFLYFAEIQTTTLTYPPFSNIEMYRKALAKYQRLAAFV